MEQPRISQQTSTAIPLRAGLTHDAHAPAGLPPTRFTGRMQWLLEGTGWSVLRPSVDLLLLLLATTIALGGVGATLHVNANRAPVLALPALVMLLFYLRGLYRIRLRALVLDGIAPVLSGVSVGAMVVAMRGLFINGQHAAASPSWLRVWLFSLVAVGFGRACPRRQPALGASGPTRGQARPDHGRGHGRGAGRAGGWRATPSTGSCRSASSTRIPARWPRWAGATCPCSARSRTSTTIVAQTGVSNLIVAFSSVADARVSRLIQRCQELGVEVSVVPRMFDTINDRVGYDTVGGLPLMSFTTVDPNGVQFALKHALDRVFALLLLLLLSPVMLCAAIAVRLSSPGPVLFRQRRVGRDGREFDFYKFRSMRLPRASGRGPSSRTLTRKSALEFLLGRRHRPGRRRGRRSPHGRGRFLRRTSLDELPQLFNVLRGEMSLVGPRPERPEFVELFGQDVVRYGDRHRVKSGITGWAQVHGLRGQTSLAERVEWDNYYIANWSLGLDLKILALTLAALFRNAE